MYISRTTWSEARFTLLWLSTWPNSSSICISTFTMLSGWRILPWLLIFDVLHALSASTRSLVSGLSELTAPPVLWPFLSAIVGDYYWASGLSESRGAYCLVCSSEFNLDVTADLLGVSNSFLTLFFRPLIKSSMMSLFCCISTLFRLVTFFIYLNCFCEEDMPLLEDINDLSKDWRMIVSWWWWWPDWPCLYISPAVMCMCLTVSSSNCDPSSPWFTSLAVEASSVIIKMFGSKMSILRGSGELSLRF